jgi:sterol desaturase/sphingolipid hydroxylase (fatty acid hydroxylase superfamily)
VHELLTKAFAIFFGLLCVGLVSLLVTRFLKPAPATGEQANFRRVHPARLFNGEFKIEIFYPFLGAAASAPVAIFIITALMDLGFGALPKHALAVHIYKLPIWAQVIAGLLAFDISLYVRHRFVHHFMWPFHAVHHSAKEITWLTSKRLHPIDAVAMQVIDALVLYLIGFTGEALVIASAIKDVNNYFVHSNVTLDYPKPLKWIFVSPNMHRWHHATEKSAHDKNYCVVFAFIDLLFGTYYVPDKRLPESYGSGDEVLDDIARKNVVRELLRPFVVIGRQLAKPFRRAAAETATAPRPP